MTHYSIEPENRIFVKGYGFSSFVKNMSKNIGKDISKNLSGKCIQKLLDHARQSDADALKTASIRAMQKVAEGTGGLSK